MRIVAFNYLNNHPICSLIFMIRFDCIKLGPLFSNMSTSMRPSASSYVYCCDLNSSIILLFILHLNYFFIPSLTGSFFRSFRYLFNLQIREAFIFPPLKSNLFYLVFMFRNDRVKRWILLINPPVRSILHKQKSSLKR